jgi:hypothetical protein
MLSDAMAGATPGPGERRLDGYSEMPASFAFSM